MSTNRKNIDPADENTVPEPGTDATPTDDVSHDQTPAAEASTEGKPTHRSLEWWKAKAREHQATIDTLTTERDALQARLDTVQQREVESLVTGKLHDPGDLFRFGPPLAEMLDDDGNVGAELVDAALAAVVAEHPHLSVRHGISPAAPASMVTATGVPDPSDARTVTFKDLLSGAVRNR